MGLAGSASPSSYLSSDRMTAIQTWLKRRSAASSPADEAPRKMVVGLGNPGPEYARSRHNIGFQVLDLLAGRHNCEFDRFQKRARLVVGRLELAGGATPRVILAKPMTYMNASGESVGPLAAFYKIAPADILVVFDDLDLPLGKVRLRAGGGAGGQKGVQSIIKALGTDAFPRLRMGIGRPPGQMDPAAYVLQPFSPEQEKEMAFVRPQAADAIEMWLTKGIEAAMNQYNG
jgi:PTH1 family peptidyl-tRNA hydrolase